ncbi:MAG: L-lactate permease, partial [Planctomycetia bacterium]
LGLDPLLICTANSTGGVMGKMIDAQSIGVSATATGTHRQEGAILRRVFPHSLALAFVTRYSGTAVTLGLALTGSGAAYPFCAALLGWLGVALTGSDTSSNAMFGSLQRVTAEQLGLDPLLICTANSTGGVMGKMIDAQSIVVSATATGTHRQEGAILRRVFPHSLALAALMGLLVWLQSGPLAWMVP